MDVPRPKPGASCVNFTGQIIGILAVAFLLMSVSTGSLALDLDASVSPDEAPDAFPSEFDAQQGVLAYQREDFETAFRHFLLGAIQGDLASQVILGGMYLLGKGVTKNPSEAVRWFRLAGEQGVPDAQLFLGMMLAEGVDVQKDDVEAAVWFRRAAEQGDPKAQFRLGVALGEGWGVRRDDMEAVRWLQKAAAGGLADAQAALGVAYSNGIGVPRSDAEAFRWYQMAAEQGFARAQFNLAHMYLTGSGVPRSETEAVSWFRKAAEQGDVQSQFNLGVIYDTGSGVSRNYTEAANWFLRAAKQGNPEGQFNIGVFYTKAKGVRRDLVQAYKWISLAGAQGLELAREALGPLEQFMTRDQVLEAQRLAATFSPKVDSVEGLEEEIVTRRAPKPSTASAMVRRIQRYLEILGYRPGPADGLLGPQTRRAIQEFQRDAGIEPDAVASSTLEAVLAAEIEKDQQGMSAEKEKQARVVSTGTGFFVNESGHILTNHHVIEGCSQIRVALPEGASNARRLAANQVEDLAIIHIEAKAPAIAAFRRTAAALGEDVLVAGYPLRGLLSGINITTGSISSTSGIRGNDRYVQITAPVQPGNSGGPLLDSAGLVLGVVVGKLDAVAVAEATGDIPQNVNFAIKGAVARSFLSIHNIEYREAAPARDKRRAAIAEEARNHTVMVECWK